MPFTTAVHTLAPGFVFGLHIGRTTDFVYGPRLTWTRWGGTLSAGLSAQTLFAASIDRKTVDWTATFGMHASSAKYEALTPCGYSASQIPFHSANAPTGFVGYALAHSIDASSTGNVAGAIGYFAMLHASLVLYVPVHHAGATRRGLEASILLGVDVPLRFARETETRPL